MYANGLDGLSRLLTRRRSRRSALAGGAALSTALIWSGSGAIGAQGGTPVTSCPATSVEENVALVRRYFDEVWNGSNLDLIDEIVAEDVVRHFPNRPGEDRPGKRALAERIRERRLTDFPDLQVTVEDVFGEGDLVVARTLWTGTHSDELEHHAEFTTEATGKAISHSGIGIFRIACGKFAEQWIANDELGLLQQIGAIPAPYGVTTPIPQVGMASPSATPGPCLTTTPDENKRLVRRLYDEVLNGHDLSAVDELHAEHHAFHQASRQAAEPSDDAVEAQLGEWLSDYPDLHATIDAMVASGDEVAVRWSMTGTQQGDFEQAGVAGTGQAVAFGGITIYRVACGEIAETWTNWDALALYRQLIGKPAATPQS